MKLEKKHIFPYVPYDISIANIRDGIEAAKLEIVTGINNTKWGMDIICGNTTYRASWLNKLKLVLHPLSDITKKIEHNGQIFIPLVNIALVHFKKNIVKDWLKDDWNQNDFHISNDRNIYEVKITKWQNRRVTDSSDTHFYIDISQLKYEKRFITDMLIQWHFDVSGLIDEELAVDINKITIK